LRTTSPRKDHRDTIPAITTYVVWGIAWRLVPVSLTVICYSWQSFRSRAIQSSASPAPEPKAKVEIERLDQAKPVVSWNLVASGVIAAFLWPIAKPFPDGRG
jgi:hypothetical protein